MRFTHLDASTHQKMFADQPPVDFHSILVLKLLGHGFGFGGRSLEEMVKLDRTSHYNSEGRQDGLVVSAGFETQCGFQVIHCHWLWIKVLPSSSQPVCGKTKDAGQRCLPACGVHFF